MYYIYLWFNILTNEVFYVGMGTGDRRFQTKQRSDLFKKYYEENDCAVRLVRTGLTEDEARQIEREYIAELNPCCNQTKGGERTNEKKISKALTGRQFSDEHRQHLSEAAKIQWQNNPIKINCKEVVVLDKDKNLIKKFDAKYKVGIWLNDEFGYGKHSRAIQRKIDKYFKTRELFDNRFYFVEY